MLSWGKSGKMDKKSGFLNFLAGKQNFIQHPTISYRYYVLNKWDKGSEPCPFNFILPPEVALESSPQTPVLPGLKATELDDRWYPFP